MFIADELGLRTEEPNAGEQEMAEGLEKQQKIVNFLQVPFQLERFLFLGYLICLDAFLSALIILPLRLALSIPRLRPRASDVVILMITATSAMGLLSLDYSLLYHSVRGQSALKLYVIFNVLEVADKLLTSFGLDLFDSLMSSFACPSSRIISRLPHTMLAVAYVLLHGAVLTFQMSTLNVAVNSHSHALLTLLVSNQFVELKSAVFKKFEKDNLFQLACGDVVERFQLSLYLLLIAERSLASSAGAGDIIPQVAMVWGSELVVDWLKHAFITKFNHIQPQVYDTKFLIVLRKDVRSRFVRNPAVLRKVGFSVLPLSCLFLRSLYGRYSLVSMACFFVALVGVKICTSLMLDAYAIDEADGHHGKKE